MKKSIFFGAAMAASCMLLNGGELPQRILSSYTGQFLGADDSHFKKMTKALGEADFNAIEVKIQQKQSLYMDISNYKKNIEDWVKNANDNGLIFQLYLYPEPYTGLREVAKRPKHNDLPPLVDMAGTTVENSFALNNPDVWRQLFHHAFQFAELSKDIPIATLKFDIETINSAISYDDASWSKFCAINPEFELKTSADARYKTLQNKNATQKYADFFADDVGKAVKEFAQNLHKINPGLVLGYMPAHHGYISDCFTKNLSSEKTPVIVDDWSMYNGGGFNPDVLAKMAYVKKLNPKSLYIPWFRTNGIEAVDVASSAYHAGTKTDGYSQWTLTMLDDNLNSRKGYDLPGTYRAKDYLDEYKKANAAIKEDVTNKTLDNPNRIAFKAAKPLVPPIYYDKLQFPNLIPQGSGKVKGSVGRLVLRDPQTIFIYAKSGDNIDVTLSHLAGKQRPMALQYALLTNEKKVLRNEAVTPGSVDNFKVIAPYSGLYALTVSGGEGGLAWYGVEIKNPFFAVDASKSNWQGAYLFGPQTIYVPGANFGNSELKIVSQESESYYYTINDGEKIHLERKGPFSMKLPDGIVKIKFEKSPTSWGQNFVISIPKGKNPYIYSGENRLLLDASTPFTPAESISIEDIPALSDPEIPVVNPDKIKLQNFTSSGSGSEANGSTYYVMRGQNSLYLNARKGEWLRIKFTHLVADKPLALRVLVFAPDGKIIADRKINRGKSEDFSCKAPEEGTYCIVFSSGEVGTSWYGVRVFNPFFAFNAENDAYFFTSPQIIVPGKNFGNRELIISSGKNQIFSYSINGGEKVISKTPVTKIALPEGLVKIVFDKVTEKGFYTQDFHIKIIGDLPLIFPSPERGLKK